MAEIFTVPVRGVGKPDYSREVSSAIQRAGISLKYGQEWGYFLRVFSPVASPICWVTGELPPVAPAHLIDGFTGLYLPFTVWQGYLCTVIEFRNLLSEDVEFHIYIDGDLINHYPLTGGPFTNVNPVVPPICTSLIDPEATTSHAIDFTITNIGEVNMFGDIELLAVLTPVGTPPLPVVKTVRCKFCAHEWDVPKIITRVICPNCGRLNIFYSSVKFRGTT